ncbi:MAG: hypothetical protein U0W24_03790 [Bacteroidales bacterium]
MTEDKNTKLLLIRLQSQNKDEILSAIDDVKETGRPELISALLDILVQHTDIELQAAVFGILNELKNQKCAIEIVNALKSKKYNNFRNQIYLSCWSSGLDYSEYLPFFVELFIAEDFINAFEIFTLIETFEREYDVLILDKLVYNLKSCALGSEETKNRLLTELIHLLENKKTERLHPN